MPSPWIDKDADIIWLFIWFWTILIAPETTKDSTLGSNFWIKVVLPSTIKSPLILNEPVTCKSFVVAKNEPVGLKISYIDDPPPICDDNNLPTYWYADIVTTCPLVGATAVDANCKTPVL